MDYADAVWAEKELEQFTKMLHQEPNEYTIRDAARDGDIKRLRNLCTTSMNAQATEAAAENGHLECLKYLIEKRDAPVNTALLIESAAISGQMECLRYLLERYGDSADTVLLIKTLQRGQTDAQLYVSKMVACLELLGTTQYST